MSKTAVIVALLVAVCLGIAAIVLTGGNGTPGASGPLLSIEPSTVTEIRMVLSDGREQAVERRDGRWVVSLKSKDSVRSWPAAQTQVHSALRIFANLVPEQEATGVVDAPAGVLSIRSGEATQTLKISSQRLAGRVLVEASGRAAWVDADIAEMLVTTGIQAWRDPAALPGLGGGAAAITLLGAKGRVSLGQVQGKWGLREPFPDAADPEAVARLLGILSAVRIVDFCDQSPPTHTGLDAPVATLDVSSSSREAGDIGRWRLDVGAAAGIADNSFVARVTLGDQPPQVVIVAGEQLAAISTDPVHYLVRPSLRAEPADIGFVAVTSPKTQLPCRRGEFRRTLDGWESRCDGGEWKPVLKGDAQAVQALIDFCTTTIPEAIEPKGAEAAPEPTAVIEVGTAGGTPLGTLAITISGTRLIIVTDHVRRHYAAGVGGEVAEWLGRR